MKTANKSAKAAKNHCPHCFHDVTERTPAQEVHVDFCGNCGTFWLDFGTRRPGLHRAVEAQAARWELEHSHAG